MRSQFECEVWPDNADSVGVFVAMETQWRVGSVGPYGLDYGVLPDVMRMQGIPRSRWSEVFEDVRVMEPEALKAMKKD